MKQSRFSLDISSAGLHILGMVLMFLDHTYATIAPDWAWLNWVGRLAFPIFAFLTAQGYFHTKNFKGYLGRMVLFALLAELPFNLMCSGGESAFYPQHQNVLFTLALSLVLMRCADRFRESRHVGLAVFGSGVVVLLGSLLGSALMLDYYGIGVVTVLVFYFFRERTVWSFLFQAVCLGFLNIYMMETPALPGLPFALPQQALALLALIPIWLYRGRRGNSSVLFRWFCYFFYPAHILVLVSLALLGLQL